MKMNKKGESISMSVIIIAAIALLVLVILAVLVLRSSGGIKGGTDCVGLGGVCKTADDSDSEGGVCGDPNMNQKFSSNGKLGGCQTDEICCVRIS